MQIRRLREERGYSLEELAERSGLSFRGLIYIEHGQRSPSVLTLLDIAAGLDVEPGNSSITSLRKNPVNRPPIVRGDNPRIVSLSGVWVVWPVVAVWRFVLRLARMVCR